MADISRFHHFTPKFVLHAAPEQESPLTIDVADFDQLDLFVTVHDLSGVTAQAREERELPDGTLALGPWRTIHEGR